MTNYNTIGNQIKGKILRFSEKISKGLKKTQRKFVADMLYGISGSKSCVLTEIGRSLKEDIELKKTEERIARNLKEFSDEKTIVQNHLNFVKSVVTEDTMIILDPGDVSKPCSPKMESIGSIRDGSTGEFTDGYWTMGAVLLTPEKAQPIPVYENLYPCTEKGGQGFNIEVEKALQFFRDNKFSNEIVRVLDRGNDSGHIFKSLHDHGEKFIIRQNQNRKVVHNGEIMLVEDVASRVECTHEMEFRSKTGNVSRCKIGITTVTIVNFRKAKMKNFKVNLVVCKEWGQKPLVLYTNLDEDIENIALKVVKGYLMRWRIEEFYAVKKQCLKFENFRVRSLRAIKTLDLLVTVLLSFNAFCSDNIEDDILFLSLIVLSKRVPKLRKYLAETKFFLYAIIDGIAAALAYLRRGISSYFATDIPNRQISFFAP